MTVDQLKAIACKCAKAKPQSYYAEPFEPHQWVLDAMAEAYQLGRVEKTIAENGKATET